MELLNRPRHTQGCRVNRRRRGYPQDCTMNTDRCEKLKMLVRDARSALCHDTPVHIYRVFEVERSIFWKVTVSVILRKETSYGHVCGCEWLPRGSCLRICRLNFVISYFLWGWMTTEYAKGRWTQQTNCWLAFWMQLAA
jgi:hypothetical protein